MDSRIVLCTFCPSVSAFLSLVDAPRQQSTAAQIHCSLKRAFPQHTIHINPSSHARVLKASDLTQLQRAILTARAHRRRLKAVTDVYSASSQAALADGAYVLDLSSLNAQRESNNVLTAQAGASLSQLVSAYELRIQAPLNGVVQSVGGAIASGLLGASKVDSLLADCCTQISVMDAFGRLRVYTERDGGVMFDAVRVSMGVFGVVYEVSFRLQTECRYVRLRTCFQSHRRLFGRGCGGIRRRLRDAVGLELFWLPFNSYRARKKWRAEEDLIWVRVWKATQAPRREAADVCYTAPTMAQWLRRQARALAQGGYGGFERAHTAAFCRAAFAESAWKMEGVKVTTSARHAVHLVQTEGGAVSEVSVCVPVGGAGGWEALSAGWGAAVAVVEEDAASGEFGVNGGVKARFVGGSEAVLAANRAECSVVLSAWSARGTAGWERASRRIAAAWMALPGARWVFSRAAADVVAAAAARRALGRDVELFRAVYYASAVDDYGMFVDDVVDAVVFGGRRRGGGGGRWEGPGVGAAAAAAAAAAVGRSWRGARRAQTPRAKTPRAKTPRAQRAQAACGAWVALYVALYAALWLLLFGSEAASALTRR